MSETPPTNSTTEIEDEDTLLAATSTRLIAENNVGPYIKHVIANLQDQQDKDKIESILTSYFRFYTFLTANDIHIKNVQILRNNHNKIYTLLLKVFKSFKTNIGMSDQNNKIICQMLKNITYVNISDFYSFTSLQLYKEIQSAQDKFIEEEKSLQQKREAIVEKFEDVYFRSGISSYSKDFSELGKAEKKAKEGWLFLLAASSSIFLFWFCVNIVIIQLSTTYDLKKIVIFIPVSLLAFLVITWVGRRYTMCREQEITYNHLTTILSTYKAFQENLDETNKGILILEIARIVSAIPKPLAKESPPFDYAKIIDIVKILNKDSK